MSDLTKLMAQNILFSDGETLQQKLENGAFVGPEGKPGEDGTAATLSVGKVTTGAPGTKPLSRTRGRIRTPSCGSPIAWRAGHTG